MAQWWLADANTGEVAENASSYRAGTLLTIEFDFGLIVCLGCAVLGSWLSTTAGPPSGTKPPTSRKGLRGLFLCEVLMDLPPLRFVDRPVPGVEGAGRLRRILQYRVTQPDGRTTWIDVPYVRDPLSREIVAQNEAQKPTPAGSDARGGYARQIDTAKARLNEAPSWLHVVGE